MMKSTISKLHDSIITIHSVKDLDENIAKVRISAENAHRWIATQPTDPLAFLRSVKFEKRGYHPITGHEINLIEQVNQTWTYTVALEATRILLEWFPDCGGFTLAPGATASQDLDIMSIEKGLVGAETFAATSPESNQKIWNDLNKLRDKKSDYKNRYIFFASPKFTTTQRQEKYKKKREGIEVWSLAI